MHIYWNITIWKMPLKTRFIYRLVIIYLSMFFSHRVSEGLILVKAFRSRPNSRTSHHAPNRDLSCHVLHSPGPWGLPILRGMVWNRHRNFLSRAFRSTNCYHISPAKNPRYILAYIPSQRATHLFLILLFFSYLYVKKITNVKAHRWTMNRRIVVRCTIVTHVRSYRKRNWLCLKNKIHIKNNFHEHPPRLHDRVRRVRIDL